MREQRALDAPCFVAAVGCGHAAVIRPLVRYLPSSAWIFPSRRGSSTGLVSKSSQPAASDFSLSSAIAWAVSAITGIALRRRIGLHPARRLPAVEHRQAHVHQDQVGLLGRRHGHALAAVDRDHHLEAVAREAARQHVPVHLVVFDQKNFRHCATVSLTLPEFASPGLSALCFCVAIADSTVARLAIGCEDLPSTRTVRSAR